jgi:hypothetical protein
MQGWAWILYLTFIINGKPDDFRFQEGTFLTRAECEKEARTLYQLYSESFNHPQVRERNKGKSFALKCEWGPVFKEDQ